MNKRLQDLPRLFISVEGGDGTGKSTQVALFKAFLEEQGVSLVATREPGGCAGALILRKLLLEGEDSKWDGLSELLLYSAARNEHLRMLIRPSLAKGLWVLSDRFADTTRIYQGMGRGLPEKDVAFINNMVVKDTWPNLTLILDMPVSSGLVRAQVRKENPQETRFEKLSQDFHERVRQGFLIIAKENPQRCRLVNAKGSIEEVQARMQQAFWQFVNENFPEKA